MNNKIVIVGVIFIILFVPYFFLYLQPKINLVNPIKESCGFNEDLNGCYTDSLAKIAIENKDILQCEKGKSLFSGDFNIHRCYEKYLESLPYLEECQKIKTNQYFCLSQLAQVKKDPAICLEILKDKRSIDPEFERDYCFDGLRFVGAANISICEQMGKNSFRSTCVESEAIKNKDVSLCEKYIQREDEVATHNAVEVCKYLFSVETNDASVCSLIEEGTNTRKLCDMNFGIKP